MKKTLAGYAKVGYTTLEIAHKMTEKFGERYTRNSIIGACHRLGYELAKQKPTPIKPKEPIIRKRIVKEKLVKPLQKIAKVSHIYEQTNPLWTHISEHKKGMCGMAKNGAALKPCDEYCGHPVVGRLLFCRDHALQGYQKREKGKGGN